MRISMKKKVYILLLLLVLYAQGMSQSLNRAEYFFDIDPGTGNGVALPITPAATIDANFPININSLTSGFHNLNIRLRDNTGKWSHFQSRTFYLAPLTSLAPPAVNVTRAEYFIDNDPGLGSGVNVPITPTAAVNQNIVVPVTSLTPGFHNLNFRVRDDKGKWSHFASRTFYIVPPSPIANSITITKAEYFFDNDPGTGLGTNISITSAGQIDQNIIVPVNSLTPGFHNLNFRVRDDKGRWSHFASRTFYIVPPPATPLAANIKKAEYFLDTDPGTGLAIAIPVTVGNPQENSFAIDINSLSPGFHRLAIRYQDNQNHWSHFAARTFYILPGNSLGAGNITRLEYFIDTDPEVNPSLSGTALPITPATSLNQLFAIDLGNTPQGNHILYVRAKDDKGFWSTRVAASFTLLACTPPPAPLATGNSRCDSGTLTLNATSGATGTQVYRWYDDPVLNNIIGTGPAFTTPVLTATKSYYVSVYDPATACESARTTASATITVIPKPSLNTSGTITLCEGTSYTLSAPAGFASYTWSNGLTTQQIKVNTNGTYSVIVSDGTCSSTSSDAATVVFSAKPARPVIQTSGTTNLCNGSTVTLTAPAGFTYQWSTGATSQQITVSTSGNYSVTVADGSNCPSDVSAAVAVTAYTQPVKPTIEVFGSITLCGTNTVGLLAPSGFSVYQWSSGQTTQGITVATAGNYSLVVGNVANCLSPASDVVTVISTNQPCSGGGTSNLPPVIDNKPLAGQIESKVTLILLKL
jgi:Ig-like domain CHU_C associated